MLLGMDTGIAKLTKLIFFPLLVFFSTCIEYDYVLEFLVTLVLHDELNSWTMYSKGAFE
jgi:hypothetical protein